MTEPKMYVLMTTEIILKHIRVFRPELDFEKLFPQRTEETAEIIARLYSRLSCLINQDGVPNVQFNVALMGWKATTTTMSALEIFRRGYPTESAALLRNVVEIAAVITHLRRDPSLLGQVLSGRHDSTMSITPAKQTIPIIGQFYGALCTFTHVKPVSLFPGHVQASSDGKPILLVVGGGFDEKQKSIYNVLLNDIELALVILESSLEFALHPFLSDMRHWTFSNGSMSPVVSSDEKERIQKRIAEMEQVAKDFPITN